MLRLQRWPVYLKVMVMLLRWSVKGRENGHVTEVVSLMEGQWSCYRGGYFNGGRMVILERWTV